MKPHVGVFEVLVVIGVAAAAWVAWSRLRAPAQGARVTLPPAAAQVPGQRSGPQASALPSAAMSSTPPQNAAPQNAAPQNAAPQNAAPQNAAPQNAAPQNAAPQNAAPQNAAPQNAAPQNAAPQNAAPQNAAPQNAAPQNAAPQAPAPQPDSTQPAVAQSEAPAPPPPAPAVEPPPPPKPEHDHADSARRILEAWEDPAALKALAAQLTERGDPRGELLAIQLQGPAGSPRELELIAANQAHWVPPGTKAKAFDRGLPVSVEWESSTRPEHAGWLSVEELVCTADPTTPGSPLDGPLPRLKHLHGLRGSISDPHWRKLYKRVATLQLRELDEAMLKRLANTLPRFERLERLSFTESHVALPDLAAALVRAAPPKLAQVELPAWGFGPRDVEAAAQALAAREVRWSMRLQVGSGSVAVHLGHAGASLDTGATPDRGDLARARELVP